jgi:parvulin-like peptidyl-prolyl isomerase
MLLSPAFRRALVTTLVASLLLACHRKPSIAPDVIARAGERMITLADFKRYVERSTGTELAQMTPEVASALLDQYLEEVLLSEYAVAHGIEASAEKIALAVRNDPGSTVIEKRDEMRRNRLIGDVSGDIPIPAEAQVRDYYHQHVAEFRTGEEIHVKQILLHDEKLADEVEEKLHKGASFEEISNQYSSAPNAKKGGDIGYVSRGELPKVFEDEIFALRPGSVSKVIKTDSTFHIFKVDDHRGAGTVDYQTAQPVIRDRLKDEAMRQAIAGVVSKARAEIGMAILTKRLPFTYSGALPRSANE